MLFRLLAPSKLRMQNCKVSRDLYPPIESKLSRDNLVDSSHVILFAVLHSEFLDNQPEIYGTKVARHYSLVPPHEHPTFVTHTHTDRQTHVKILMY